MYNDVLVTRRVLVRGSVLLGASALVAGGALSAEEAFARDDSAKDNAQKNVQYGFLVDASKCVNCRLCVDACRRENKLSDDTADRRSISTFTNSKKETVTVSTSCMHCGSPSCLEVCPAGAISKNHCGIVSVDKQKCIGCKYCYQACPYEVPQYNTEGMDKCDCCLSSGVPAGGTPYCVRACKFEALRYGPLEDLEASVGGRVLPIAEINNPSCLLVKRA